ncbi:arylesterase [Desulfothermus okinawensis JCM 13304]
MVKILAFGNSLTEGFGLRPDKSFASILEKRLKDKLFDCHVINAGLSGDTTFGGLRRLDFYLEELPHVVVLELGINDGFLEYPIDDIRSNLDKIIEKSKGIGAEVLLIGARIPEGLFEIDKGYCKEFEEIFTDLAKEHNIPLVHDILGGIIGNPSLTLEDLVHPNEQGVEIMVDKAIPDVINLLKKNRGRQVR